MTDGQRESEEHAQRRKPAELREKSGKILPHYYEYFSKKYVDTVK